MPSVVSNYLVGSIWPTKIKSYACTACRPWNLIQPGRKDCERDSKHKLGRILAFCPCGIRVVEHRDPAKVYLISSRHTSTELRHFKTQYSQKGLLGQYVIGSLVTPRAVIWLCARCIIQSTSCSSCGELTEIMPEALALIGDRRCEACPKKIRLDKEIFNLLNNESTIGLSLVLSNRLKD